MFTTMGLEMFLIVFAAHKIPTILGEAWVTFLVGYLLASHTEVRIHCEKQCIKPSWEKTQRQSDANK